MERELNMRCPESSDLCAGGFTIIEVIIVLAIASILMAIGMPSFQEFSRNMRAGSTMGALVNDIQLARSESVKRNTRVLFCARATPASSACAGAPIANTWMNGWIVCQDGDANGNCDASTAANPNPIKIQGALAAPMALTGPAATLIVFPVGSASAGSVFTITGGTNVTRTATVAPSGSVVAARTEAY